jgi:Tfp pilus assembly PilM family ATPase
MKALQELIDGFRRGPRDVVGIDIGSSAVKAVRLRSSGDGISVVATAILPPNNGEALNLPSKVKARHAALTFTGPSAIVKLLSFPGQFDETAEGKVVDNMGLDDPDLYRISYKIISEGQARGEARVLTVAWPEEEAATAVDLLPLGLPAPFSYEISGLSTMTSFLSLADEKTLNSGLGIIDFGDTTTTYALFNRGLITLVRRFNFGTNHLLERVQSTLGVDRDTAQGIITDGSFDISQSISDILESLVKQMIVSRDFVERRENCRISSVYVAGGLARSQDAIEEISSSMEVDVHFWNPFEGMNVNKDAIPPELEGKEWRLAAAAGACLGVFEDT